MLQSQFFRFAAIRFKVIMVIVSVSSRLAVSQFSFRCADDQFEYTDHRGHVECRQCSACPPGYGVARLCSLRNDTMCHSCPRGSYSVSTSRWNGCLRCKTCATNQLTKTECSPTRDRDCSRSCTPGYYYDNFLSRCNRCSYCFSSYGIPARISECQVQGVPKDYQCMIIRTRTSFSDQQGWVIADRGYTDTKHIQTTDMLGTVSSPFIDSRHLTTATMEFSERSRHDTNEDLQQKGHRTQANVSVESAENSKVNSREKFLLICLSSVFTVVGILIVMCLLYYRLYVIKNCYKKAKEQVSYIKVNRHESQSADEKSVKIVPRNSKTSQNNAHATYV